MGSNKRWFFKIFTLIGLILVMICLILAMICLILVIVSRQRKDIIMSVIYRTSFTILLFCLCFFVRFGLKLILERRKLILNNSISKADDLFTNIASMIPTGDKVDLLECKAQVYLKYIKRAFRNRSDWPITFKTCGSVPERFGVPLVSDWISNIGKISDIHALVSDQDFLIERFGITASYSAQCHTVEIVRSESYIEEGYAKLRVSRCLARTFNLKEGFLSTTAIKELVIRCISKVSVTKFLGLLSRIDQVPWLGRLAKLLFGKLVKIHGPAIKLHTRHQLVIVYFWLILLLLFLA